MDLTPSELLTLCEELEGCDVPGYELLEGLCRSSGINPKDLTPEEAIMELLNRGLSAKQLERGFWMIFAHYIR